MKFYETSYDDSLFKVSEYVPLRKLTKEIYSYEAGYFSRISVFKDAIVDEKDGKYKLDVMPKGVPEQNYIDVFTKENKKTKSILVNVDVSNLKSMVQVESNLRNVVLPEHSDVTLDVIFKEEVNFSNKIYLVLHGEKLKFKKDGKTIFIIDNTKESPCFINVC